MAFSGYEQFASPISHQISAGLVNRTASWLDAVPAPSSLAGKANLSLGNQAVEHPFDLPDMDFPADTMVDVANGGQRVSAQILRLEDAAVHGDLDPVIISRYKTA
ncbi:hypothetical protein [Cupriavidus taiwanensis]|uniref:hypothetical protein n=1 Tax=Cupriavidus taiwanensis TaxID=164546 RepID=UPI0011C12909|nr:hypothetical protein [Cupriavidus taiwanensis]